MGAVNICGVVLKLFVYHILVPLSLCHALVHLLPGHASLAAMNLSFDYIVQAPRSRNADSYCVSHKDN